MKFLFNAFSLTLLAVGAQATLPGFDDQAAVGGMGGMGGMGEPNCHDCGCFQCGVVSQTISSTLDISVTHCKGTEAVSWICCTEISRFGSEDPEECTVISPCTDAKCDGVVSDEFVVSLPMDARSFTINTHDGLTVSQSQ